MIDMNHALKISVCILLGTAAGIALNGQSSIQPSTVPATDFKPAFAAMQYFDVNCARCHGPQGSFYGKEFGRHLSDEALTKVVHEMAEGPGNAPLKEDELKIVVAYHRSLIRGDPFISITARDNGILHGEATPASHITVDGKPAQIEGFTWSAPEGNILIAERDKKKTTLRVRDRYSHQKPIAAEKK